SPARAECTGRRLGSPCGLPLLEVLQDLQGGLCVARDLLEDLEGRLLGGLGHLGGVLETKAVFLRLAVAREQQHGTRESGLDGERQVEQDERINVPLVGEEFDGVDDDPDRYEHALDAEEPPRADSRCGLVGNPLPEGGFVMKELVDGVLVLAGNSLPRGSDGGLNCHQAGSASSSRRICNVSSVFFLISVRIFVMCCSPLSDSSAACSSVMRSF